MSSSEMTYHSTNPYNPYKNMKFYIADQIGDNAVDEGVEEEKEKTLFVCVDVVR